MIEAQRMKTYQLMVRVLKEQCVVEQDEATKEQQIIVKANRAVPSDSLQNPSDPNGGLLLPLRQRLPGTGCRDLQQRGAKGHHSFLLGAQRS